jgi:hypothetical protein
LAASFVPSAASASSPTSAATGPKTNTLFMGTDVSVEIGQKLYRVQDVNGSAFIISVDGRAQKIPMFGGTHNLKVEHTLKLGSVSASVTGLAFERAYTPGRDPQMRRQIEAMRVNAAIGDNASLAEGRFVAAQNHFGVMLGSSSPITGAAQSANNLAAVADAAAADAMEAEQMADAQMQSGVTNAGFAQLQAESDLRRKEFDAVKVDFEISSEIPLSRPYMILNISYREKNAKPGTHRNMIYARALDQIDNRPRKIHVLQGGLPRGYELDGLQVHLYDDGREIATTVAPKRVALTRDEAYEYLMIDYLANAGSADGVATPAVGRLTPENRALLTPVEWKRVYFVKVSADGKAEGAFRDEECSVPAEKSIATLARTIRFYPALMKGKPVAGVARLVFADLNL